MELKQLEYFLVASHLHTDMILNTDICSLGLDFMYEEYGQYDIKSLKFNDTETFLSIGYVFDESRELSNTALKFIDMLIALL